MTSYRSIKRLKALIPTLRERKRYVSIKIISDEKIEKEEIKNALYENIKNLYGKFALAYLSFRIKFDKDLIILKCNHISLPFIISSLGFLKEINRKKVIIKVLAISGTIKKLKLKSI